jgi:uncharacterized membrane protein
MAKDAGDMIGALLGTVVKELAENVSPDGSSNGNGHHLLQKGEGALSGGRGVAAGAALAGAIPLAGLAAKKIVLKRIGNPVEGAKEGAKKLAESAKDSAGKGAKDAVGEKVDQVGGAPGVAKEAGKKLIPGLGGGGLPGLGGKGGEKGKKGTPGVGKGRRMPVQQEADIGVPISVAYNQWTQFEEWPQFMHRLDQATQEDDCTVSFRTKVWGMSKEFTGEIVEQRPDERIQWTVSEGVVHTGVVTFHELAPRLTRVQVSLDVEPGSLLEKAARGMRHVKRAVRADLHRFKAFIEMQEVETGAWRGEIHDGEVVEEHDRKYDRQRDYAEFDDIHDKESSHKPQKEEKSSSSRSSSSSASGGRSRQKKRSKPSSSRKRGTSHKSRSQSKGSSRGSSRKKGS